MLCRHVAPEIEFQENPELLLPSTLITNDSLGGGGGEACLVEPSINSVRVSFQLRVAEDLQDRLGKVSWAP